MISRSYPSPVLVAVGVVLTLAGCGRSRTDAADASVTAPDGGGGADSGAQVDGAGGTAGHECAAYTAQATSGSIPGQWAAPNAKNTHEITAPNEPGGGYYEVAIEGAPVGPKLEVLVKGVTPAVIGSADSPDGATSTKLAFEVAGGQTIEVRALSVRNAPADQYPVPYTITWKYQGRADCYEPNDTRAQAKLIPLNTDLEAWALYNRASNYHVADGHFDWYRIELKEAAKVTFELLSVPKDVVIGLHAFYSVKPGSIANSVAKPKGQVHAMDLGALQPGVYFIHVETPTFDASISSKAEPLLDHFVTPYKFRVRAE